MGVDILFVGEPLPHLLFFGSEQCTVREEDGKLISETGKFTSVREIQGEEMIEVSCCNSFENCSQRRETQY